jgi:hypothetical protein
MKVKVKLFGNLSQRFPDYKPTVGIVVVILESDASVRVFQAVYGG